MDASARRAQSPWVPKPLQRRVRQSLLSLLVIAGILAFVVGLYRGGAHIAQLKPDEVTLSELPSALALSFFRIVAAYLASLLISFLLGLLAARTKWGERVIVPIVDILQSVPVVGFFPAAIGFFIGVFDGHRVGVELAAIFLIFTSQAWNMVFAVYEATKTIPQDNSDAIASFGVRGSLRFWKLYAPACVPRLVYNSILSWSNGWYFLVACEIIAIGNLSFHLPGIGSFLALAAEQDQMRLVFWGLVALMVLILGVDALLWRPLSIWSERFRQDFAAGPESIMEQESLSWGITPQTLRRLKPASRAMGAFLKKFLFPFTYVIKEVFAPLLWDLPVAILGAVAREVTFQSNRILEFRTRSRWLKWILQFQAWLWALVGIALGLWTGRHLIRWLTPPWPELASQIPLALLASTGRLVVALLISLLWIMPVVLWVWNKPRARQALSTVAQVGASLPAVALFPLIILITLRKLGGGMEMASIILLITGMQWYILFNALGGTAIIPGDLAEAARALGLSRWGTWKKLVLPAIRPALITGMITAWGGGWNALVVSEYVAHKGDVLTVNGIGSLLNHAVYELGDHRAIGFCLAAMVAWIIILNAIIWRPLYQNAAERYKLDA